MRFHKLDSMRESILLFCLLPVIAGAGVIELFPGDSFESAAESLQPGDTLVVHAGTYEDSGRVSIGVKGTASQPVVIEGAAGEARPLISRPAGAVAQNTINIEGATYLTIRGLEIVSNGGDGINMSGNPAYITIEDNDIHDIDVGINFRSDMHHIVARNNHIHRTNATGEGMYVGCNQAACAVTDSLIEGNWIHDTLAASQGDGIEIKRGSHSNIIRDNVIHDTNYPCILLYGTEGNPRNLVEGNVMWNCGDSGIQVAADAIVRNNIILESPDNGLNSQPHQGVSPGNLDFVHNTIVGGSPCLRLGSWDGAPGMVFANNAVYCPSDNYAVGGISGVTITGNVFDNAPTNFPGSGYSDGRSATQDLVDPVGRNVYPTPDSPLLSAGAAGINVPVDFNGTLRTGAPDVGAYTYTGVQNPGWPVGPGFKDASPGAPSVNVTLDAADDEVAHQDATELTWSASNAVSCLASGGWSGPRPLSGSESTGSLSETSSFSLACQNADGIATAATVTVAVVLPVPGPTLSFSSDPATVDFEGFANLDWQAVDADTCLANGGWTGSKATTGQQLVGPLVVDTSFSLGCSGPGGQVNRTLMVRVRDPVAQPPPDILPADSSSGGGSALGYIGLLLLVLIPRRRQARMVPIKA
jgi:hypothetical protein